VLLKHRTPLFVALVAFVGCFLFMTALGALVGLPLFSLVPQTIGSAGIAGFIWWERSRTAKT
jgi:hypothetical protein